MNNSTIDYVDKAQASYASHSEPSIYVRFLSKSTLAVDSDSYSLPLPVLWISPAHHRKMASFGLNQDLLGEKRLAVCKRQDQERCN